MRLIFFKLVIGVFLFTQCNTTKESTQNSAFISISKTGCLGICPEYKASIYKNGKLKFNGTANVIKTGTHTFQLSKQETTTIKNLAKRANFDSLNKQYNTKIRDIPITSITFNNKCISIGLPEGKDVVSKELLDLKEKMEEIINNKLLQ